MPKRAKDQPDQEPLPPFNEGAEKAIIGCLLRDPESAWPLVEASRLQPGDFYQERWKTVFQVLRAHRQRGELPSFDIACRALAKTVAGTEQAEWSITLLPLFTLPGPVSVVGHNARHIMGLAGRRQANLIAGQIVRAAHDRDGDFQISGFVEELTAIRQREANLAAERISGDDLFQMEFAPQQWLVDRLVATGTFTAFGGKAKLGKGYFSLQLAASVSHGTPFLGRQTQPAKTLFLALEDGKRRLNERMQELGTGALPNVEFVFKHPPLDSMEGFLTLAGHIQEVDPLFVIVDTLAGSKGGRLDENLAKDMAPVMTRIQQLAQSRDIAIWGNFHHGKLTSGDALLDLRGSSAIGGAVDAVIGLYRDKQRGSYTLSALGRDVPEVDLELSWDPGKTFLWTSKGEIDPLAATEAEEQVLQVLKELGGEAHAKMVAAELGMSRQGAAPHLRSLAGKHKIQSREGKTSQGAKVILYSL